MPVPACLADTQHYGALHAPQLPRHATCAAVAVCVLLLQLTDSPSQIRRCVTSRQAGCCCKLTSGSLHGKTAQRTDQCMCSQTQLHLSAGCWYVSHNVDPLFMATCHCGASAHPCIWYTISSVFAAATSLTWCVPQCPTSTWMMCSR